MDCGHGNVKSVFRSFRGYSSALNKPACKLSSGVRDAE